MPGEDGYGLLVKVRGQQGESARLPAVALTAYASRDDRIRLLSAGFQAHVPKPVDPEELVTVVAKPRPNGSSPLRPVPNRPRASRAAQLPS